jgi:transposase
MNLIPDDYTVDVYLKQKKKASITDRDIAFKLGVSYSTFRRWKIKHKQEIKEKSNKIKPARTGVYSKGGTLVPSWFTVSKYVDEKLNNQSDQNIADTLFVSKSALLRWKTNRIELITQEFLDRGEYYKQESHNRKASVNQIKNAIIGNGGASVATAAKNLGISRSAAYRALESEHGMISPMKMKKIFNKLINEKPTIDQINPDGSQNLVEALKYWYDYN